MEPKLNRFSSTHLLQLVLHSDCNCYSNVEKHSLFIISPARHESCHYSITWHSHPWQTTGSDYQRQQIVVYVARLFGNPFYHFIFLAYFFFLSIRENSAICDWLSGGQSPLTLPFLSADNLTCSAVETEREIFSGIFCGITKAYLCRCFVKACKC